MTILSTFTHHIYSKVGDIESAWLTKSVIPNILIQSDSNTFSADKWWALLVGPTAISHLGLLRY